MPSPLEAFRATDRTTFDTDFWNRYLAAQVAEIEGVKASARTYDAAVGQLLELGLVRINDILAPAFAAIEDLAHLGVLLSAHSSSNASPAVGVMEFVIDAAERARFAPAGYLWATAVGGTGQAVAGPYESYNPATGVLLIDADTAVGSGAHGSWQIAIGLPQEVGHASRTDNPHGVTAVQTGAATPASLAAAVAAEATARDTAIAAAIAALKAGVGTALDTLDELAAALGDDANFAATVTTALAGKASIAALRGYLSGFTLANNAVDATNDIDIAAGAGLDTTNAAAIVLASAMTKRLDAAWAAGTGNGGLDTGAKANSTWYHVHAIRHPGTEAVDVLFSTSPTAPTLPSGYTQSRRLGSVRTDGAGALLAFTQSGDEFHWKSPPLDIDVTNLSTTRTNYALSVPPSAKVLAFVSLYVSQASTHTLVYLSDPDSTDLAPSITVAPLATMRQVLSTALTAQAFCLTNSSQQIAARSSAATTTLKLVTLGWTDPRGKG